MNKTNISQAEDVRVAIPFQPGSDERDVVSAAVNWRRFFFVISENLLLLRSQPLCQSSFFIRP